MPRGNLKVKSKELCQKTQQKQKLPALQKLKLPQKLTVAQARKLGWNPHQPQALKQLTPQLTPQLNQKRNKYGNRRSFYNGRWYDSQKEANRAHELDVLLTLKQITRWEPQIPFEIKHNGVKICSYVSDFKVTYPDGHIEYEDVKSKMTKKLPVYRLKKKLVKAFFGIDIKET